MAFKVNGVNIYSLYVDGVKMQTVKVGSTTVLARPTITTQPVGGGILDNQTKTLTCVGTSLGGDISYRWSTGATSSSISVSGAAYGIGTHSFNCVVTNGMGSVTSITVQVVVSASFQETHTMTVGKSISGVLTSYGWGTGLIGSIVPSTLGGAQMKNILAYNGTANNIPTLGDIYLENKILAGKKATIESEDGPTVVTNVVPSGGSTSSMSWVDDPNFFAFNLWLSGKEGQTIKLKITLS